ncbi:DUF2861 family protein [Vibrio makurazakiensis]|uniref:DUF2861 family protein n=1 Tax=Vibrio makurazakiensis TaxID=2910250 RepID=UPI003D0ADA42
MKAIRLILGLVSASLTFSHQAIADDWFMPTPLASTYSALAAGNTQLAWQEMLLALSQKPIDERHWAKAKKTLISQSQCGKQLISDAPMSQEQHIRLTIQKKTNLVQQGYQLKVSLDGVEQSAAISLRDQQGRVWFSGKTSEPEQNYVELESDDLVYAPTSGFYQLTIDQAVYPIILSSNYEQPWIKVNRNNAVSSMSIRQPKTLPSCQIANMRWQWFDDQFSMLGYSQPIQLNSSNVETEGFESARLPESFPSNAKWLSAVVSQWEYQGVVKVEYAQRVTLPNYLKVSN